MAGVTLERVTKRYRDVVAVQRFDLEIRDREMLAIVGPSGCGKTTVIRLIAGLERPDEGVVYYDGQDMTEVAPRDRNVAMVFEDYALFPHMTVAANVGFGLKIKKVGRSQLRSQVGEVMELAELTGIELIEM